MARKDITLDKVCKTVIDNPSIHFIEDLAVELGVSKSNFYLMFPTNKTELDTIKGYLGQNKTSEKRKLRDRWSLSDSAPLQISLYKLLGSQEERDVLNGQSRSREDTEKTEYEIRGELYD